MPLNRRGVTASKTGEKQMDKTSSEYIEEAAISVSRAVFFFNFPLGEEHKLSWAHL